MILSQFLNSKTKIMVLFNSPHKNFTLKFRSSETQEKKKKKERKKGLEKLPFSSNYSFNFFLTRR